MMLSLYSSDDSVNSLSKIIIEIELSQDSIRNTLIKSDANLGYNTILEIPSKNFLISGNHDIKIANEFSKIINTNHINKKNRRVMVNVGKQKYFLFSGYSKYSNMVMSRYIPEGTVFEPLKKFQLWYWTFSFLAVITILLYIFSLKNFIQKPINELVNAFAIVKGGNFQTRIEHVYKNEFFLLCNGFNEMVENIETLIEQVYQQKILTQKAELKQLQSQINPHFLFNSFFILSKRIKKGEYKSAETFCQGLGVYFKYITRSASDEVRLDNEVEHARIYAEIQAARFANRIKVEFDLLPVGYESMLVPKLILQPIIENAFEHGLDEKEDNGLLRVSFHALQENGLNIIVEDNGNALTADKLDEIKKMLNDCNTMIENTALLNTHKRIRLAFGEYSGINVSIGELGGLKLEIRLISKNFALN